MKPGRSDLSPSKIAVLEVLARTRGSGWLLRDLMGKVRVYHEGSLNRILEDLCGQGLASREITEGDGKQGRPPYLYTATDTGVEMSHIPVDLSAHTR